MTQDGDTTYRGSYTETNLDDGVYVYKVVKTDSDFDDEEYIENTTVTIDVETDTDLGLSLSMSGTDATLTYTTALGSAYSYSLYIAEEDAVGGHIVESYALSSITPTTTTSGDNTNKEYDLSSLIDTTKNYKIFVKATYGSDTVFVSTEY